MEQPKATADGKSVSLCAFYVSEGPDIWEGEDDTGAVKRDVEPFPFSRRVQTKYAEVEITFFAEHPPREVYVEFQGKKYDKIVKRRAEKLMSEYWQCDYCLLVSA